MKGYIIEESCHDPCHNLAFEECLVEYVAGNSSVILYLWQNAKTIVIGRNQDRDAECDMDYVKRCGITIVRRKTGGGAVYHDLGNLNFSIIVPKELYNVKVSTGVIIDALNSLGIDALANDRNDILVGERKISGNAYYEGGGSSLHHGTIMYDVDIDVAAHALTPAKVKLQRNKVASVASRVANLKGMLDHVTLGDVRSAVKCYFKSAYADVVSTEAGNGWEKAPDIKAALLSEKEAFYRNVSWIQHGDKQ